MRANGAVPSACDGNSTGKTHSETWFAESSVFPVVKSWLFTFYSLQLMWVLWRFHATQAALANREHRRAAEMLCQHYAPLTGVCSALCGAPPSLTVIGVCCGCLVAEDIGVHQLERLVELLTPKECEDLLFALSHPEENIFQHLERLSPERNQLHLEPRAKRDASSAAGRYSTSPDTHLTWGLSPFRPQRSSCIH